MTVVASCANESNRKMSAANCVETVRIYRLNTAHVTAARVDVITNDPVSNVCVIFHLTRSPGILGFG